MKIEIYSNVKNGNIDVLVATKAFGVGVNIPHIRYGIHIEIPLNLSCLVQESGRAGRDGHQAHSYVMQCKYQDIKNSSSGQYLFHKRKSKPLRTEMGIP